MGARKIGTAEIVSRAFAAALGSYLVVEGVWGHFGKRVFGVLPTNRLRASIHVALGLAGIAASATGFSRQYCAAAGGIIGSVGLLRFVPRAAELEQKLLAVNPTVGIVNSAIGASALTIAAAT